MKKCQQGFAIKTISLLNHARFGKLSSNEESTELFFEINPQAILATKSMKIPSSLVAE